MDEDLTRLRRATEQRPDDATAWLGLAQAHARAGAHEPALEAARRALTIDPALDEARALARRAYVEVTAEVEPPGLREAIGRALGRPGPWTEPEDWDEAHLLGGSVHAASGTVAWVEDLQRETPGSSVVDCRVTLHVARGGRELLAWPLAHDNPYFGTALHHASTDGERVVLVYREKHRTLAAVISLDGPARVVAIGEPLLVLHDQVVFAGADRGVFEVRGLPDLAARLPLPGPSPIAHEERLRLAGDALGVPLDEPPGEEHVDLPPGAPPPLLGLEQARHVSLDGPLLRAPRLHADALLGAVAHPFWVDAREVSTGYPGGAMRWSSPHWLPVYWHRHLVERGRLTEAAALLLALEDLARRAPPAGDDPRRRLARHLTCRAAELVAAIRAGHQLPPRAWCFLWADWSNEAFEPWLERFPPGFVEVFRELRAARPRPLAPYDDPAPSR